MLRASLRYKDEEMITSRCGGVLITKNYVLTASHCLTGELYRVRLGEHDLGSERDCDEDENCLDPVQDIEIAKRVPHPNYNHLRKINDIALLKLKTPADITKNNVKLICLPMDLTNQLQNIDENARKNMIVSGWGITETGRSSNVLRKAIIPYVNQENCKTLLDAISKDYFHSTYLCAGASENSKKEKVDVVS